MVRHTASHTEKKPYAKSIQCALSLAVMHSVSKVHTKTPQAKTHAKKTHTHHRTELIDTAPPAPLTLPSGKNTANQGKEQTH